MRWETIQTVKGVAPCKRYGHTATLWKHFIIVFGGCNESQSYCNDIHIFDLEKLTWCQPVINGSVSARYLHSAVVYDDKLFIYGGFAKNTDCTYVLDEISVLDLNTLTWSIFNRIPPRYNHSATLVGHKMYIYAGKDEQGNTVSDLFVVNLNTPPYTPHLILSGAQSNANSQMVLLKSQHFCEALCGKLLVFGRYINNNHNGNNMNSSSNGVCTNNNRISGNHSIINTATNTTSSNTISNNTPESMYGLWMLDLDTLEWERQDCNANFEIGGWNYFTVITENLQQSNGSDERNQVATNSLFFLGNIDPFRPQGYDHFRDALVINSESFGLYDIPPLQCSNEFGQLLNNPELSDFVIVPANGQELHVHQVILITRWPHFRNMYRSGMMEVHQRRMEISEPYPVVLAFLKYLYSDHLSIDEPWQVVCDILVMANMYLLHRLKKICCQRLYRQHLTIDSCTTIFEKAIMAEEVGLKLLALDFMFNHYGAVLKADLLHQMSSFARQEFLECVPDQAILQVNPSRFQNTIKNTGCYPMTTTNTSSNITNVPSLTMISNSSSSSTSSTSSSGSLSTASHSLLHSNHFLTNSQPSSFPFHPVSSSHNNNNHTFINQMRSSVPSSTAVTSTDIVNTSSTHQRLSSANGMAVGV
ncbi:uncharacterized protein BX664DRAFT_278592 [Halteromyces radiatus]|uniref:uncharacterized protein n=1 Tax=Halteromyces radiatus TaxID=101107 RepID=UPI00221FBA33|nr:uncharacterized protein BX664DRAFT_278592 [Halteromyces radiatus]KAI8093551.1 hypothetical protein BX664DRAFT_278592 [Halteromyces radiatus]